MAFLILGFLILVAGRIPAGIQDPVCRFSRRKRTDGQLQYEQVKAMRDPATSQSAKMILMGRGHTPVIPDTKE